MKRPACLFALTLIVFAGCRSSRAAKSLDTLRDIKIERRTILTLGGKIPQASDFCDWSGATCALKPGTFAGAETMSLSKTESGLISQFHFYYGVMPYDAVKAQIDDYIRLLGKPSKDTTVKNGAFDVHELMWSDSATTFELSYKTDGKQTEASATLCDNALARAAH
jgi:hypothetical protein